MTHLPRLNCTQWIHYAPAYLCGRRKKLLNHRESKFKFCIKQPLHLLFKKWWNQNKTLIGYALRTQTVYATALSRTTGSKDSANNNDPGGMMWENHRVVLPPHSYFSYLPYTSSHLQSRSPALLTSLVKGDTAERIKSNQWTLGTLHEHPYACVAATISPIIGWFTSLTLFFFPPPSHSSVTLMHLGMFHAAADDFWFKGGRRE